MNQSMSHMCVLNQSCLAGLTMSISKQLSLASNLEHVLAWRVYTLKCQRCETLGWCLCGSESDLLIWLALFADILRLCEVLCKICLYLHDRRVSPPRLDLSVDYPRSRLGRLEISPVNPLKRAGPPRRDRKNNMHMCDRPSLPKRARKFLCKSHVKSSPLTRASPIKRTGSPACKLPPRLGIRLCTGQACNDCQILI